MHSMNRRERQAAIVEIVREQAISTQSELAEALRREGHDVVQTTVSRDVHELGLVKVRAPSGRLVYAPPGSNDLDRSRAISSAMRRYAVSVEATGNILVVMTPSGYANALAQAIDENTHPGIAGTIAGDNSIFIAAREGTTAVALREELAGHLGRTWGTLVPPRPPPSRRDMKRVAWPPRRARSPLRPSNVGSKPHVETSTTRKDEMARTAVVASGPRYLVHRRVAQRGLVRLRRGRCRARRRRAGVRSRGVDRTWEGRGRRRRPARGPQGRVRRGAVSRARSRRTLSTREVPARLRALTARDRAGRRGDRDGAGGRGRRPRLHR